MKYGKAIALVAAFALAMMLVGCGGSGSQSSSVSASTSATSTSAASTSASSSTSGNSALSAQFQDIMTQHQVYCIDDQDTYTEYQVIYYGANTHTLKAITDITQFDKVEGLTMDYLETFDVDTVYPNFSTFNFASKEIYDDGDYYTFLLRFDDLDVQGNLQALHDNGILELVDRNTTTVDADSLMSVMEKDGAQLISIVNYGKLGLSNYL